MNIPSKDSGNDSTEITYSTIINRRHYLCRLFVCFCAAGIFLLSPARVQAEKVLSAAETLQVDPTTGTANLNIPVDVLPGRGGLQPGINVLYNSGSPNGKLGMGWILELGNIRRSTKRGIPKYDATDSFILLQAGSAQELIYDAATDTYQPEIEGGFLKIVKTGDTWMVTDKQGVKYFFGRTSASRQDDPNNSSRIFQWCLDRVEDPHGNYMTIAYVKDQGQIYPDEIAYTGNTAGLAPFASVKFIYDAARTDVTARYDTAFKVVTAKRLTAVEVKAGSALMHAYRFNYAYESETKTSVLQSATRFASDGTTSLPTATFTYSQGNTNLTGAQNVTNYPADNVGNGLTRLIDLNADGYADMIRSPSNGWPYHIYINNKSWNFNAVVQTSNQPFTQLNDNKEIVDLNGDGYPDILFGATSNYQVWLNNKANDFLAPQSAGNSPDVPLSNANVIVLDMNTDGYPDLVRSYPGTYLIFLNDGTGRFQAPLSAANPPPQDLGSGNVRFADLNGDGLVDIFYGAHPTFRLHINNGNAGFEPPVTPPGFSLAGLSVSSPYVGVADMNGDGLADVLRSGDAGQPYYIYFNQGNLSFTSETAATNPPAKGLNQAKWMDMNGDGLADIVIGQAFESVKYQVSLNNGVNGFHPAKIISSFPNADIEDASNMLVDLNADGLPDLLRGAAPEPPYKIYPNPGAQATASRTGVLVKSNNGMGVTTDIEYENLPVMPLAGGQYKYASSPTLFNAVKRTVRRIGSSESYVTAYESKNGRWNFAHREFRGFGEVEVTDPAGNFTRTMYNQDDIFKGRVSEQAQYNASGAILAKTVSTWNSEVLPSGAKFAFLKRMDNFSYDGNPQGRCRAEEYFYEEAKQRGNLTKAVQLGDVSVIGDERTVETTYVNNDSSHIFGLPSQVTAKDSLGNVTRKTWFDYDGLANGSTPAAGLLTHKKEWAGDGPQDVAPETRYVYDGMGNLKSALDPLQKETAVTYDQNYNMFPVTTRNALNHTAANGYYGVDSVPMDSGLWGQLKTTTDPNNRQGSRTYDIFGRPAAGVSPLDTLALPTDTVGYEINQSGQFYKVTASQRQVSGQSGMIEQKQFFDGMGRLMQNKTKSGAAGQFIVSGQVEYNSRGLPFKQYLPYFTTVALDTPDAVDPSKPHATVEYDSLGRVTKTTNPDGTYSTAVYGDMVVTAVDENGHQQRSYFDAYGRLVKKEEYKGADGRSPYYAAAPYSLYAATQYEYDSEGNLTRTIDARGNVTSITYDKLGRKIAMDDPDMGAWTYKYDLNGNLTEQTDAKGQTIRFTYDALNRLVNKTDGGALNVNYTYDDNLVTDSKGRLTRVQYPAGETEFKYDAIGREIESIKKINGTGYGVRRNYDALNNLIDITYPDNTKIYYKYNPAGQVEAIANDPALFIGPQSWNLLEKRNEELALKSEIRSTKLETNPKSKFSKFQTSLFRSFEFRSFEFVSDFDIRISDLSGWIERNILGIREAEAATTDLITLEAENMTTKTTGGATTGGWNIWSNGYIENAVNFPHTAAYEFEIVAKGSYANGAWPNMELRIDQVKVWNTAVNSTSWASFKAQVNVAAGSHKVAVAFTNDYYKPPADRNLYVDKIIIREVLPAGPPAAPVLNPPVAGNGQIALTWNAVTGATGYKVYSGTASRVYGTPANAGNVTSFTVTGLANGTKYYWAVTAYSTAGESVYSNEQSATPLAPPPTTPPAAPVLNAPVAGDGQINLTWSAVSGAEGYKIKYGTVSGGGAAAGTDYTKDPACVAAWKLEESTGTFIDSCGVNSGTVSGTLARGVAGQFGKAIEFLGPSSGNNAVVNFGSNVSADKLGARTFTAWIYPHNLGESSRGVILNKNYQDGWVFRLAAGNNLAFSQAFSGGVVTWTTTTNAVKLNVWQHVAVTYAGSGISDVPKIYLNGVEQAQSGWTPFGAMDNDAAFDIRMGISVTTQEFDGLIDETAIFKRMLSAAEINKIMSAGLSGAAGGATYENVIDAGNATGATVTGLTNGTTYYFVLMAYNAVGESPLSNEVSAAPAAAPAADDPQVFVRHAEYNAHGQVTRLEYGNGVITTYTYDPLALRLTRLRTADALGVVLQDLNYTYDSVGNVLSITDNVNTADQTFQYDELNRLARASGQTYGLKTYAYDEIGNIKQKDGRLYFYAENGAGPHAVSSLSDGTTFTYDANGNMLTRQGPDLVTTGYAYDVENRLVKVTRAGVKIAEYAYDGDGGRTTKTAYDPANAQGTCFLAGTPVLMADPDTSAGAGGTPLKPIEEIQVGDRVVSFDIRAGEQVVAAVTATFAETAQDYLLINKAVRVTENHPFYVQGEWRTAGTLKVGDKLLNLSLNEVEIQSIQKIHSPKPIRVYNIEVDQHHNYFVTRGGTDVEGYLVHNKFPGPTANAVFAGTTHFVGSLFEKNAVRTTKFVFFGGTRVAAVTNGKVLFYHGDHLGGTNVLTDGTGVAKELTEYEPFGAYARHEKYGMADEVAHFYFTGQRTDDESGLMFYGARYYDPDIGRFITADTIVPYPDNPQALNRYSYAGNNPVSYLENGNGWFIPLIIAAVKGAAIGATVGAGVAAATGGSIGQGALLGAVSGAFLGGTSGVMGHFAKQGVTFSTGMKTLAYAEAGAYAGATSAAILGSDPLKGAGFGALSGAVFGGIGELGGKNTFWDFARIPLAGAASGGISELAGGSFIDGFIFASAITSADFAYRAILSSQGRRGASMRMATKSGQPKLDENGNLINNKPVHSDFEISQPGVPSKPAETINGFWGKFLNSVAGETGPVMNFAGKNVPGVQGLSLAHDVTGHFLAGTVGSKANGLFFNFQTMPPVYGLNFVGSSINDNPSFIGIYTSYRRDER